MKKTLFSLALTTFTLMGCAQLEQNTGKALEDLSNNAKTIPENVWKTGEKKEGAR